MTVEEMENRIKSAYPDAQIAVMDTTGTQDHFDVRIASKSFEGLTRVKRHQDVMALFAEELKTGEVHALAIKTLVL